jgi:hypothetical protein
VIDFDNPHGLPYGLAPAGTEDDREVLQLAQKWADNQGMPIYWVHWSGEIIKEVWPDV